MRDLSRRLQQALQPRNAPALQGYDIAAGTTHEDDGHGSSAWDWFRLPDGRPALITLDVAPSGFPAAHGLAITRAFLRELQAGEPDLGGLARRVNGALARTATGLGGFVECGILALGPEGVTWLSAGNVPGGVVRREGALDEFPSHGPPLGLMDGFRYGSVEVPLRAGDVAVVLSHGAKGLFRGAADLVAELHGKPAGEVVSKLQSAIKKAGGGQDQREVSILYARKH